MKDLNIEQKLLTRFRKIVRSYIEVACSQVKQEWSKYEDLGESDIVSKMEDAQSIISAFIYAWGQKAWILEFGKGSLMEKDVDENPYLNSYIANQNFNQLRLNNDLATTGRSKGSYFDLDGFKYFSSGRAEGLNLEELFDDSSKYEPIPPRRIIKNILIGENHDGLLYQMNSEFQEAIGEVYNEIISRFTRELKII